MSGAVRRGVITLASASLGLLAPCSAQAAVSLTQVGTFTNPTYVAAPPGDTSRIFVVEQGGTVRIVRDGTVLPKPFLDWTGRVLSGGERGLLSIAFAPDYDSSGLLYAYFNNGDGDIEIDELRRSAQDADAADPASARALVTIVHREFA